MVKGAHLINVAFRVNYFANWGENLAVVGNFPQFGDWNPLAAKKMEYKGDGHWLLEAKVNLDSAKSFEYRYLVVRSDNSFIWEGGSKRILNVDDFKNIPSLFLDDIWKSPFSTEELLPHVKSSIFTDVIYGRHTQPQQHDNHLGTKLTSPTVANYHPTDFANQTIIHFRIFSVFVDPNFSIRVVGSIPELGSWKPLDAPIMSDAKYPLWELEISVPKQHIPFHYKFVICDAHGAIWEEGDNRYFNVASRSAVFVEAGRFRRNFEFRGAGVAVPVFSLRSKNGLGVGEFLDLKLLVDWAAAAGLKLIQILPINDTWSRNDWRDSYPYSSISVFALHPIYIHLPSLTKDADLLKEISEKASKLNSHPKIDYEQVLFYKIDVMRRIFNKTKVTFLTSHEFRDWLKENEHWVASYALFSVLRDKFKTADWSKWTELSKPNQEQIRSLTTHGSHYYEDVTFYYFMQYHLHLQLKEASDYAVKHRIGFKGDIAIGVNPKSVDTWTQPHLFRMDKSTGAPPDPFSADGQNWGFPTYNWDEMAKDDFFWWRQRLTHMAQYFHAFRVDHILGFFRIWEIPGNAVSGLLGRFQPSIPIWRGELEASGFWDIERLTTPYIRTHLLERHLGNDWEAIRKYFDNPHTGIYHLKPEYRSEKQVMAALPTNVSSTLTKEAADYNAKLRSVLMHFIQNVVFLKDSEDPNKLYPRIECMRTSSYAELEPWQRDAIKNLYIDYYYRRQDGLWTASALQRLPVMINSTKMLCCGEDLGMVPACVPPVMAQLNILGLRIQRMAIDPKIEFMHPSDYPYMSVCTPSVHDTSTLRAWWEEDRSSTQRFWNQILGEAGNAPDFCDEQVTLKIINQHIYSRSMWSVLAIQDVFGLNRKYFEHIDPKTERINEPSNPEHYWRYRIHVNLEDLVHDKSFSEKIRIMLQYSGRL